ncbi:YueI family protein [Lacticaseibacillus kribbianus]|uniref:YueI family protein n=1 Tax=Lacticaseibacillus kribbianus TaxID=2926292 RepID=UPI001CD316DA|nr:YueI family protein [Lacticaseibacillus kribbianus]
MTDNEDVQSRLTQSMTGTPQTNPDERRHYLGSLRERAYLLVTNTQVRDAHALPAVKKALAETNGQDGYILLINGKLGPSTTAPFMGAATALDYPFRLVNNDQADLTPNGCAVLVTASVAINKPDIGLPSAPKAPEEKPSLFDRLFH